MQTVICQKLLVDAFLKIENIQFQFPTNFDAYLCQVENLFQQILLVTVGKMEAFNAEEKGKPWQKIIKEMSQ